MAKAYDEAKAGGRHSRFLADYSELPDHLIQKAIRSLLSRAAEHRGWLENPARKVGENISERAVKRLVEKKWPKEVRVFEEQIEILRGILRERKP